MKKAIFPGSFDPLHEGHIDIIKRASSLFDELYIVVSYNFRKKQTNLDERFRLIKNKIDELKLKNVHVHFNRGLTIDFANKHNCNYYVRSFRNIRDFKYELMIAQVTHKLNPNIETVYFIADPLLKDISSHAIKEMNRNIKMAKNK